MEELALNTIPTLKLPKWNRFGDLTNLESICEALEDKKFTQYTSVEGKFTTKALYDVINYGLVEHSGLRPQIYFGIYVNPKDLDDATLVVSNNPSIVSRFDEDRWGTLIVTDNELKFLLKEYTRHSNYFKAKEYGELINSEIFKNKTIKDINQELTDSINHYVELCKQLKLDLVPQ